MTVVGFDFGTTNSLVSVVAGGRSINIFDSEGLPFPSVVTYEGDRVIAGREAKRRLDSAGLGVHGNTVRSPKFLLGDELVHVGGVARSPIDIVADVVRHVRSESLRSSMRVELGDIDRAVVTMPIDMNGERRRNLREAFQRAGIQVVQFIHEPFAAIYAHWRQHEDPESFLRRFDRQLVLVVDWGGGTLDLTLCRIADGHLTQVENAGSSDVGGDRFDDAIANVARKGFEARDGRRTEDEALALDATTRLLEQCERAKIELSDDESRDSFPLYVPGFFRSTDRDDDFDYLLDRSTMRDAVSGLVDQGMRRITGLLESTELSESQVSLCLVTGGMSSMPEIRSRLYELFGPQRVEVSPRSATLVSDGAAWFAHDEARLVLARRVELALARGSHFPVLDAGTGTPTAGLGESSELHLYCADPRDGKAKFTFATPLRPGNDVLATDFRKPVAEMSLNVDSKADPLRERLELSVGLDHDLVVRAEARSMNALDTSRCEIHDLQFGVRLSASLPDDLAVPAGGSSDAPAPWEQVPAPAAGAVVLRPNLTQGKTDHESVPGELVASYWPAYFGRHNKPPEIQVQERLYYKPCSICGRRYNDPDCGCTM